MLGMQVGRFYTAIDLFFFGGLGSAGFGTFPYSLMHHPCHFGNPDLRF